MLERDSEIPGAHCLPSLTYFMLISRIRLKSRGHGAYSRSRQMSVSLGPFLFT